jgi:hypothetical protein
MKIIVVALIYSSFVWSDSQPKSLAGFDSKTDIIADNYEAGPFLIYDCKEKHWVCVMEPFYKECQNQRLKDENEKSVEHSCAPISEFPTKKSCFQRQLFLTSQHHGNRFCIKDQWKQKNVKE